MKCKGLKRVWNISTKGKMTNMTICIDSMTVSYFFFGPQCIYDDNVSQKPVLKYAHRSEPSETAWQAILQKTGRNSLL